jgi:hypothetical protein
MGESFSLPHEVFFCGFGSMKEHCIFMYMRATLDKGPGTNLKQIEP